MYFEFFLVFIFLINNLANCDQEFKKVKLEEVEELTLYANSYTIGRKPIPQLSCLYDETLCRVYYPSIVKCFNQGYDGHDVQWKCEATLSTQVKFGRITVSCEGYEWPDDPYIIDGSCGLKYSLENNSSFNFISIEFWVYFIIFLVIPVISICFMIAISLKKSCEERKINTDQIEKPKASRQTNYQTKRLNSVISSKNYKSISSSNSNSSYNYNSPSDNYYSTQDNYSPSDNYSPPTYDHHYNEPEHTYVAEAYGDTERR